MFGRIGPITYTLPFPSNTKAYYVLHVSLFKKYDIHDPNHVIDWNVTWVELKGDNQIKILGILNKEISLLKNRTIK